MKQWARGAGEGDTRRERRWTVRAGERRLLETESAGMKGEKVIGVEVEERGLEGSCGRVVKGHPRSSGAVRCSLLSS